MKWIETERPMWIGDRKVRLEEILRLLRPYGIAMWRLRNLEAIGAGLAGGTMADLSRELEHAGHVDLTPSDLDVFAAGLQDLTDIDLTGTLDAGQKAAVVRGLDSTVWVVAVPEDRADELQAALDVVAPKSES